MADLLARWIVRADTRQAESAVNDLGKKTRSSAKGFGESFGKSLSGAVRGFAGLAAVNSIKNFFSGAINQAAEFEREFVGLRAAANQTGEDFDRLKAKVLDLTQDGTLNIANVTTSLKQLLAAGQTADQAFRFLEAGRNISALNNIVGDTSQAVADLVKGITTGSSELIENADPSLRQLAKSVGGFAAISKDAAKQQEFLNKVIERGTSLQGDYANFTNTTVAAQAAFNNELKQLQAAIGDAIANREILRFITDLIRCFREFFETLTGGQKIVAIFTGTVNALGAALLPVFGTIALVVGAVTAGLGLLTFGLLEATKSTTPLADAFNDLAEKTNKTEAEQAKLNDTLGRLVNKYKLAKSESDFFNKSLKEQEKALREVNKQEAIRSAGLQKLTSLTQAQLRTARRALSKQLEARSIVRQQQAQGAIPNILDPSDPRNFQGGVDVAARVTGTQAVLAQLRELGVVLEDAEDVQRALAKINSLITITSQKTTGIRKSFKELNDFLDGELRKTVNGINKSFTEFTTVLQGQISRAARRLRRATGAAADRLRIQISEGRALLIAAEEERIRQITQALNEQRQAVAEFTEDTIEAARLRNEAEADALIRGARERAQIEQRILDEGSREAIKSAKGDQQAILDIERETARAKIEILDDLNEELEDIAIARDQKIAAESTQIFSEAADAIQNSLQGAIDAVTADSLGSALQGFGGLLSSLGPQGAAIGGIVGAVGTVADLFGGLNDLAENQRIIEEQRLDLAREKQKLLETELQIRREILNSIQAQQTFIDKATEQNLRILELQGASDEEIGQARIEGLTNVARAQLFQSQLFEVFAGIGLEGLGAEAQLGALSGEQFRAEIFNQGNLDRLVSNLQDLERTNIATTGLGSVVRSIINAAANSPDGLTSSAVSSFLINLDNAVQEFGADATPSVLSLAADLRSDLRSIEAARVSVGQLSNLDDLQFRIGFAQPGIFDFQIERGNALIETLLQIQSVSEELGVSAGVAIGSLSGDILEEIRRQVRTEEFTIEDEQARIASELNLLTGGLVEIANLLRPGSFSSINEVRSQLESLRLEVEGGNDEQKSVFDQLLSLNGEIRDLEQQIAESNEQIATSLDFRAPRERGLIDLSRNLIFDQQGGGFLSLANPDLLQSDDLTNISLATTKTAEVNDAMLLAMQNTALNTGVAIFFLAQIAAALDGNPLTDPAAFGAQVAAAVDNLNSGALP